MSNINKLTKKIMAFRDARDWKQFHTLKNLAESLSLESAEVLEYFQWKNDEQSEKYIRDKKEEFAMELADVFTYLIFLADRAGVDLVEATEKKLIISNKKYPVDKAKGKANKYTDYQSWLFIPQQKKILGWCYKRQY